MFLSFLYRLISYVIALFRARFQSKTQKQEVSLKLLVNTETNKVLFAEADKDFVDILCSFLTLPLGTIARLLQKESNIGPIAIGCLSSLNQSVENLGLLTNYNSSEDFCRNLIINIDDTQPTKYFVCSKFHELVDYDLGDGCSYLSIDSNKNYCMLRHPMSHSVSFCDMLPLFRLGFVKYNTSFIISDDLIILPHSMNHTIYDLSKNCGIQSTSSIKEMTVNVTKEKVLDLLKRSIFTKTPLTDIFLGMKPIIERSMVFSFDDVKDIFCGDINITVKLVVRKSDENILYAQGGQDMAELIIRFLTFPLGGVLRNLEGISVGSIDGLCKSIADLNEDKYFIGKEAKNRLLRLSVLHYYYLHSDNLLFNKGLVLQEEDLSAGEILKK
ncbi:unnamed protein product [Trifolium pratense]|uniref:Uncharacterized protein n=1 Tax=Trifolium pratense TaxID=57577 RepID=A0ACB0LLS1_TRIPR|nr:unnamed protein product [Trifolium pratense]